MTPRRPFLGVLLGAALASVAWAATPVVPAAKAPAKDSARAAPAKPAATPKAPAKAPAKASAKDTAKAAAKSPVKDSAKAVPRDTLPPPLRDIGQSALKAPEKLVFDVIWGGW